MAQAATAPLPTELTGCWESPNHCDQQDEGSTGAGEEWPGMLQVQGSTEQIYSAAAAGQPGGEGAPEAGGRGAPCLLQQQVAQWPIQASECQGQGGRACNRTGYTGKHPGGFGMPAEKETL